MQNWITRGLPAGLAVLVMTVAVPVPASAQSLAEQVKVRQAAMKQNAANLKAVGGFLKGGRRAGTADTVALRGQAIAAVADRLPAMFPNGTSHEDLGIKVSGAAPAIWQQWDDFRAAAANLRSAAEDLTRAANSGDKEAIKAAMGRLGKEACGGCHRKFRKKRPKG